MNSLLIGTVVNYLAQLLALPGNSLDTRLQYPSSKSAQEVGRVRKPAKRLPIRSDPRLASHIRRSICLLIFFLLATAATLAQQQGEAVDDFYIIDGQQYINVAENDNPHNQLWIITPALRGTVAICAASGCPDGTLLYTPPSSGRDRFRYCWGPVRPDRQLYSVLFSPRHRYASFDRRR